MGFGSAVLRLVASPCRRVPEVGVAIAGWFGARGITLGAILNVARPAASRRSRAIVGSTRTEPIARMARSPTPLIEPLGVDGNGCLTECLWLGDQEVIVHRDRVPEPEFTV